MNQKWAPVHHCQRKKYHHTDRSFFTTRARRTTETSHTSVKRNATSFQDYQNTPVRSEGCPVKVKTTTATPPPPPITNRTTIRILLLRVRSIPRTLTVAIATRTSERTTTRANLNGSIGEAKVARQTTVRAKSNAILFAEPTKRVWFVRLLEGHPSFTHTHTHTEKERRGKNAVCARDVLSTRLSK
jgi:hypothetical protein